MICTGKSLVILDSLHWYSIVEFRQTIQNVAWRFFIDGRPVFLSLRDSLLLRSAICQHPELKLIWIRTWVWFPVPRTVPLCPVLVASYKSRPLKASIGWTTKTCHLFRNKLYLIQGSILPARVVRYDTGKIRAVPAKKPMRHLLTALESRHEIRYHISH